ncbi:MAG: copper amine oxidase N-terminal domain-containing protein [Firmicutes bacterium]|nr:copper amine oxidase N-terminal domain-containing protein [Bacillota bacterium]
MSNRKPGSALRRKTFAAGVVLAVIFSGGAAFAAGGAAAVTAYINGSLRMTYNGAEFKPAEADGSGLPALIYNDRTYLPARALAEKAGVYVGYDSASSEVILKSENELLDRANLVLHYLKYRDFVQLSAVVSRGRGVTFSPYAFVEDGAVTLTADKVKALDTAGKYTWGAYDGSGNPIELCVGDYFDRFVYDRDFIQAPKIGTDTFIQTGNTISNLDEAFPDTRFVEYNFPGDNPDYGGADWASLRLVFEKTGGEWLIVGVVHDCWTI